jgi:beta-lactamase regulating signal transducer with metallopeptidase domain
MTTPHPSFLSFVNGQWLPLCMNLVLQSLVLLIMALIALKLSRQASAAQRHLLLTGTLGALLLLPVFALLLPARRMMTMPPPGSFSVPADTHSLSIFASSLPARTKSTQFKAAPSHTLPSSVRPLLSRPAVAPTNAATAGTLLPRRLCALGLFALWSMGSPLIMARFLIGWTRLWRFARHCSEPREESLRATLDTILAQADFQRPIQVLQAATSESAAVPMTWGVWRPVLLLPANLTQWPQERLRVAVLHELAHIRRGDWLTQALGQIVCSLYWFQPLVWRLYKRAQMEAESACDDAVLLSGVPASEYATHLLSVVCTRQRRHDMLSGAVPMARPSQVSERVQAILNPGRSRGAIARSAVVLWLLMIGLALIPISHLRPLAQTVPAKSGNQRAGFKDIVQPSPSAITYAIATPPALSGYRHTFACGLTLTLAGLTERQADGGRWWQPNGTLFAGPLKDFKTKISLQGWSEQEHPRVFLFNQTITHDLAFDSVVQFRPDSGQGKVLRSTELVGQRLSQSTWNASFPPEVQKCTLRYGVAAGPWHTLAVLPMPTRVKHGNKSPSPYEGDMTLVLGNQPHLQYQDLAGYDQEVNFLRPGTARPGNDARRFVAVETAGKLIPLTVVLFGEDDLIPLTFRDTGLLHTYNPIDLSRIREFRLQTRPYEWAEFRNIALQPTAAKAPR